jgi:hypothetical protein
MVSRFCVGQASDCNPPTDVFHVAEITGHTSMPGLLLIWDLTNFLPAWPQIMIFQSISQSAGLQDTTHHT